MREPGNIARYRLAGELGRDRQGVVYRAEDPEFGGEVAIAATSLPQTLTRPQRAEHEQRFVAAARVASEIQHPSVVAVLDFGRDGDVLYVVMELVSGRSLADRLDGGWQPTASEALELVAQIADGLGEIHRLGLVHGGVTPHTLLFASDGTAKLTAPDVAREFGGGAVEVARGTGTPDCLVYLAPEQILHRDLDGRTDLFSLAALLYRLLTGDRPFEAPLLVTALSRILRADPLEDPGIRSALGAPTADFLATCLAKAPADRIPCAEDFARQARRLLARAEAVAGAVETSSAPSTPPRPIWRGSRRWTGTTPGAWLITTAQPAKASSASSSARRVSTSRSLVGSSSSRTLPPDLEGAGQMHAVALAAREHCLTRFC